MTDCPANYNETLRWWLAKWDADYNRNAGAPRPTEPEENA